VKKSYTRVEILPIWNSVHIYAGASDTFFYVLRQLATAVVKSCPKRRHSSPTKYETVPWVYFSFYTSEKNKAYQFSTIADLSLFSVENRLSGENNNWNNSILLSLYNGHFLYTKAIVISNYQLVIIGNYKSILLYNINYCVNKKLTDCNPN